MGTRRVVSMLTRFNADNPGKAVYHCHILPHEDNGMMANMLICPPGSDPYDIPEDSAKCSL